MEKQLARTVTDGRQVTFVCKESRSLTGYLGGWDEEHLLVISPSKVGDGVKIVLLAREAVLWKELHAAPTLDGELYREQIETVVLPFRRWVNENLLGKIPSKSV